MPDSLTTRRPVARILLLTAAISIFPALGQAHPSDVTTMGVLAGLEHPWTGLDHIAAMLAIGLWARYSGEGLGRLCAASVIGIVLGAAMSQAIDLYTFAERCAALSAVILGLLVAVRVRVPFATILVGGFCAFHGYVHAVESPQQFSQIAFSTGFLVSMLLLQGLGAVIATTLARSHRLFRSAGVCCALAGLVALLAVR